MRVTDLVASKKVDGVLGSEPMKRSATPERTRCSLPLERRKVETQNGWEARRRRNHVQWRERSIYIYTCVCVSVYGPIGLLDDEEGTDKCRLSSSLWAMYRYFIVIFGLVDQPELFQHSVSFCFRLWFF